MLKLFNIVYSTLDETRASLITQNTYYIRVYIIVVLFLFILYILATIDLQTSSKVILYETILDYEKREKKKRKSICTIYYTFTLSFIFAYSFGKWKKS